MPLISIVSPLYNKGPFVHEMIESVLRQTVQDWELIVVDNLSTDDGPQIVKAVVDSRVQLLSCAAPGPAATRNEGLRVAKGEWVLFLDADDALDENYLDVQLKATLDDKHADVFVGAWRTFVHGRPVSFETIPPAGRGQPPQAALDAAFAFPPWAVHAAIVRRSALAGTKCWPEDIAPDANEDMVFWFRLLQNRKVHYTESIGALYRSETPNSRDHRHSLVRGWHAALTANADFLRSRGLTPTANQCENAMRGYSGLYQMARRKGDRGMMELTVHEAKRWFENRIGHPTPLPISLRIRQLLGFNTCLFIWPTVAPLRSAVQRVWKWISGPTSVNGADIW